MKLYHISKIKNKKLYELNIFFFCIFLLKCSEINQNLGRKITGRHFDSIKDRIEKFRSKRMETHNFKERVGRIWPINIYKKIKIIMGF